MSITIRIRDLAEVGSDSGELSQEQASTILSALNGTDDIGPLLTVREAAEKLNVSTDSIRRWMRQGDLNKFTVAGGIRLKKSDVTAFVKKGR